MEPRKPARTAPLLAALLGLALGACGTEEAGEIGSSPTEDPTNLLLITLDTTRADRLGSYGHGAAHTLHMDGLAAGGARFERAYAHVPLTLPTHASLLTGTFPPEHGLHDNGRRALGTDLVTLAEVFRERGYRTGAFVSAIALDSSFGLDRGFDVYDDHLGEPPPGQTRVLDRPGGDAVDGALAWLAGGTEPFFLWVHFYDPHAEYRPPADFRMDDPYDGEIAYMDSQIGRLLGWLEAQRIVEDTLVAVIADHGESLGEKGEHTHGALIYEGTQRIPWILSQPGRIPAGLRLNALVQQVDLMPSLLEMYDWPPVEQVSGRSFAPLLRGEEIAPAPVYLESEYSALNFGWSSLRGIVRGRWKLIAAPQPELYDLLADPGESRDLAAERPELVRELSAELDALLRSMRRYGSAAAQLGEGMSGGLAALGYAQGTAPATEQGSTVNPMHKIEVLELYHAAIGYGNRGLFEQMLEPLERVVAEVPDGAGFRTLLGDTYRRVGRYQEARVELDAALELDPDYDPAHFYSGALHETLGEIEPGIAAYRRNIALRPSYVPAREGAARLFAASGDPGAALREYEEVLRLEPELPRHRLACARLEWDLERPAAWLAALREAARLAPEDAGVQNSLAWALATAPGDEQRDGAAALALASRLASATERRQLDVLVSLAAAEAETGDFEAATETLREAIGKATTLDQPEVLESWGELLSELEAGRAIRAGVLP